MTGFGGGFRGVFVVVALILLAACDGPTVPLNEAPNAPTSDRPYDFRLSVPAGQGEPGEFRTFHWPLGSTVRIVLGEEVEGRPSLGEALSRAVDRWNRASLFGELTLAVTSDPGRADAILRWEDTEPIYSSPSGCTGPVTAAAATRGCLTPGSDSLRIWPRRDGGSSRLVFRVTVSRLPDTTPELLDGLVSHELGHVVGILAHSGSAGDLMGVGFRDSPELSDRDRLTLRSLYQTEPDLFVAR